MGLFMRDEKSDDHFKESRPKSLKLQALKKRFCQPKDKTNVNVTSNSITLDCIENEQPSINRTVVRLKTTAWVDCNGNLNYKKCISILHRKSFGFNALFEDIHDIGAIEVIERIINLDICSDGVYEVVTCNEHRDWETGYIDDYDFKLVEFTEGIGNKL